MGLFLSILAIKNKSEEEVENAIKASKNDLKFVGKESANEITGQPFLYEIEKKQKEWTLVFLPESETEKIAELVSNNLKGMVFFFHLHDGSYWMFELYDSGKKKDQFNPMPDDYQEVSDEEKKALKGQPKLLSETFKVPESKIKPYLQFWEDVEDDKKAFSTDEFPIKNEWSFVDFMQKFNIKYPDFEHPENVHLTRLIFKKKIFGLF